MQATEWTELKSLKPKRSEPKSEKYLADRPDIAAMWAGLVLILAKLLLGLLGFNAGLELHSELLPTTWNSSLRMI